MSAWLRPRRLWLPGLTALAIAGVLALAAFRAARLEDNRLWSGWTMLSALAVLAAFNLRKRVPSLPVGGNALWLGWHVWLGLATIAVIHIHIGWRLPIGTFSWLLYSLYWSVVVTGLVGLALGRLLPPLLATIGGEIIYERIPERALALHAEAAAVVEDCAGTPGAETLKRHFVDRLDGELATPRRTWRLGAEAAIAARFAVLARAAGPALAAPVADLLAIVREKLLLDRHWLVQGVLKGWLFVHIPLAVLALIAAIYHAAIILAYHG